MEFVTIPIMQPLFSTEYTVTGLHKTSYEDDTKMRVFQILGIFVQQRCSYVKKTERRGCFPDLYLCISLLKLD